MFPLSVFRRTLRTFVLSPSKRVMCWLCASPPVTEKHSTMFGIHGCQKSRNTRKLANRSFLSSWWALRLISVLVMKTARSAQTREFNCPRALELTAMWSAQRETTKDYTKYSNMSSSQRSKTERSTPISSSNSSTLNFY